MNGMHFVTVENIQIINPDEVLFTIDLASHVHLTDPNVVQAAMDDYMARYSRVAMWHAYAVGGKLNIKVTGDFDHEVALSYIAHYR